MLGFESPSKNQLLSLNELMTSIDVGCTCWCLSFSPKYSELLVFNERYVPTRDRTKATTHRQTRNIPCSLGFACSSTCPPSELYDIRHQSQSGRDDLGWKKSTSYAARCSQRPKASILRVWANISYQSLLEQLISGFCLSVCGIVIIYFEKSRTYQRANRNAETGIGRGLLVIRYSCCDQRVSLPHHLSQDNPHRPQSLMVC